MTSTKRGGARKGAGRKPFPDPRKPAYVRLSAAERAIALSLGKTLSEGVQTALEIAFDQAVLRRTK